MAHFWYGDYAQKMINRNNLYNTIQYNLFMDYETYK